METESRRWADLWEELLRADKGAFLSNFESGTEDRMYSSCANSLSSKCSRKSPSEDSSTTARSLHEQPSVASVYLIVQRILEKLSLEDLKSTRRVSQEWLELSTQEIRNRDYDLEALQVFSERHLAEISPEKDISMETSDPFLNSTWDFPGSLPLTPSFPQSFPLANPESTFKTSTWTRDTVLNTCLHIKRLGHESFHLFLQFLQCPNNRQNLRQLEFTFKEEDPKEATLELEFLEKILKAAPLLRALTLLGSLPTDEYLQEKQMSFLQFPFKAPSLKLLKIFKFQQKSLHSFEKILDMCVNLKEIWCFLNVIEESGSFLKMLMRKRKTELLKNIDFYCCPHKELGEVLEDFCLGQWPLGLKKIHFFQGFQPAFLHVERDSFVVNVMNMCFKKCARTLEAIDGFNVIKRIPGIEIPLLENLTCLAYQHPVGHSVGGIEDEPLFSLEDGFLDKFPHLEQVVISYDQGRGRGICSRNSCMEIPCGKVDDSVVVTERVKSLEFELHRQVFPPSILYFVTKYPALKILKMPHTMNFPQFAKFVWRFESVEILEVALSVDGENELNEDSFPGVDMAFTGLPESTCLYLFYKHVFPEIREENSCRLREQRHERLLDMTQEINMTNLKKLKKLRINMINEMEDLNVVKVVVMSRTTGRFAFQKCPQVQVTVEVRKDMPMRAAILEGLKEVRPYVHRIIETPGVALLGEQIQSLWNRP